MRAPGITKFGEQSVHPLVMNNTTSGTTNPRLACMQGAPKAAGRPDGAALNPGRSLAADEAGLHHPIRLSDEWMEEQLRQDTHLLLPNLGSGHIEPNTERRRGLLGIPAWESLERKVLLSITTKELGKIIFWNCGKLKMIILTEGPLCGLAVFISLSFHFCSKCCQ